MNMQVTKRLLSLLLIVALFGELCGSHPRQQREFRHLHQG